MSNLVSINNFGNSAGGILFTIVPIFIGVVFLIVFGIIIYRIINFVMQKMKDKESIGARIIAKREDVSRSTNSRSSMHHNTNLRTTYYASFELENNRRVEFMIPRNKTGALHKL